MLSSVVACTSPPGDELRARTASLQNYIYFDSKGETQQHSDLIQVLALRARQAGSFGPINWDLEAAYQQSSAPSVLPTFAHGSR